MTLSAYYHIILSYNALYNCSGLIILFLYDYFHNFCFYCMFYQLLCVQHSCSSTQSWGTLATSGSCGAVALH